ncbi:UPF0103-domain-containing protein [Microthyrium microscopicum]|uniref:UPF0103-domain-containing protein n=1 Tax=Microthyrium microscopicum TaxID=703497 RepID=A0A6A6U0I5_9PEZI|nr:UPF0103-domain-containing protein [Microthyrium microscopicum]
MATREASHAGDWYDSSKSKLNLHLDTYLNRVPEELVGLGEPAGEPVPVPVPGARAIIAPHAGYSYSGPAAAWAYKSIDWSQAKRVFLLGPSHHYHLSNCALSQCAKYDTPLGALTLDRETIAELKQTGEFAAMKLDDDEAEHSLEMHLPYIYKMLKESHTGSSQMPPIVPILIGSTSAAAEKKFGAILAPYLEDPANVFVISSDFCHWGTRFRYTYYKPASGPAKNLRSSDAPPVPHIHESIAAVDRMCWEAVETGQHNAFLSVLEETGNTVCGRHPIGVMMAAVEEWRKNGEGRDGTFRFVRYERSSLVQNLQESSVSYCSAYAIL